jgi:hypothetical protein
MNKYLPSPMPLPMDEAWESIRGRTGTNLGGSTGARMHSVPQHPSGQRFVSKRGAHPQHILNEFDMNRYLDALGVGVPDAALFEHQGKPNMLTRFEERASPLDLRDRDAVQRVRQDFVPHAAIGNWDALGLDLDNVLIRPDGTPTYVDVGGSGPFRAMGGPKGDAWGSGTSDLDTMQFKPPHTQDVFGNMSEQELGQSFDRYGGEDAFMDALQHLQDASTRNIMQQRVEDIARRVA